jgi:ribosomal protein S27AE
MNIKNKLKKEKCPHCGVPGALFICSFGGVNCAECGQFVRMAEGKELEIAYKKFKKLYGKNKEPG